MKSDKYKNKKTEEESSSSTSSEDDENAELLTEDVEEGFFKALSHLKKKDSALYDENVKFYSLEGSTSAKEQANPKGRKRSSFKEDYKEWLKGQKNKIEDKEVKQELDALHDFWTNPNLNEGERFLRDYILNKKFLECDETFNIEKELEKLDEEEKEEEKLVTFEHSYNCRFEKPDGNAVGTPQNIDMNKGKKMKKSTVNNTVEKKSPVNKAVEKKKSPANIAVQKKSPVNKAVEKKKSPINKTVEKKSPINNTVVIKKISKKLNQITTMKAKNKIGKKLLNNLKIDPKDEKWVTFMSIVEAFAKKKKCGIFKETGKKINFIEEKTNSTNKLQEKMETESDVSLISDRLQGNKDKTTMTANTGERKKRNRSRGRKKFKVLNHVIDKTKTSSNNAGERQRWFKSLGMNTSDNAQIQELIKNSDPAKVKSHLQMLKSFEKNLIKEQPNVSPQKIVDSTHKNVFEVIPQQNVGLKRKKVRRRRGKKKNKQIESVG